MTLVAGSYERFLFGYAAPAAAGAAAAAAAGADGADAAPPPARLFTHPAHKSAVRALAAAGPFLASGGADDTVHLYDQRRGRDLGFLVWPGEGAVTALAFAAPPGRYAPTHLLAGGADGRLAVFRAGGGWELMKTMRGHRGAVAALAVHPSGRVALSAGRDARLRIWDMVAGRAVSAAPLDADPVALAFSPGGGQFLVAAGDVVTLHAAGGGAGGGATATLRHPRPVLCAAWGRGERVVVTGCEDGAVRVWAAEGGRELLRIARAHENRVKALAMPHCAADDDGAEGGAAAAAAGGGGAAALLAEVPELLATASSDGELRVWALRRAAAEAAAAGAPAAAEGAAGALVWRVATRARLTTLCVLDPPEVMAARLAAQGAARVAEQRGRGEAKAARKAVAKAAPKAAGGRAGKGGKLGVATPKGRPDVAVAKGKPAAATKGRPAAAVKGRPAAVPAPPPAADVGVAAGGVVSFVEEGDRERERKRAKKVALNAQRLKQRAGRGS
jgi:hypothetical protein